jgi:hypothetical protein
MRTIAKPTGPRPALKSMTLGERRLVLYDSLLEVIGIDPATEPDRPKTVTIQRAVELTGISKRTIDRMIARGRAERTSDHVNNPTSEAEHAA